MTITLTFCIKSCFKETPPSAATYDEHRSIPNMLKVPIQNIGGGTDYDSQARGPI